MDQDNLRARLAKLMAMLGSTNEGERETARKKIDALLRKHKKNWSDIAAVVAGESEGLHNPDSPQSEDDAIYASAPPVLDMVYDVLGRYIDVRDHERVAIALWILHTHCFRHFMVTPRLALLSPVRGCGKTIVASVIERLAEFGFMTEHITAAALFRHIDGAPSTLIIDEGDNQGFRIDNVLRSVLNSGHRKGGKIVRVIHGAPVAFSTFAPVAIAAIGTLPLPLAQRSIVIDMQRSTRADLRRIEEIDQDLDIVHRCLIRWRRNVTQHLSTDPEMPPQLKNRQADNWRALISIADTFGPAWGKIARDTAVQFARGDLDEDVGVMLIRDIITIYDQRGVDRMASAALAAELVADDNAPWCEFRGVTGNQPPRPISPSTLSALLRPFGIRPKTIWPPSRHRTGGKSARGYLRSQFLRAFRAYCGGDTPSHPSGPKALDTAA